MKKCAHYPLYRETFDKDTFNEIIEVKPEPGAGGYDWVAYCQGKNICVYMYYTPKVKYLI